MLAQLQTELVAVQSSLFCLGLELEASQRSLRRSQRQGDDLSRFKDRLNSDLQEVQQYREVTEKHNQVSVLVDMCVKQILVSVGCSMCDSRLCRRTCALPSRKPALSCRLEKRL